MPERDSLRRQLYGESSHVHLLHALEDLDMGQAGARPNDAPHSIFQLVRHMIYWQDLFVRRMRGDYPQLPASAAEGWDERPRPANDEEWHDTIEELSAGLWEVEAMLDSEETDLDRVVSEPRGRTVRDELLGLLLHNSYHVGQIVSLRRLLGTWPPPQGGDTW